MVCFTKKLAWKFKTKGLVGRFDEYADSKKYGGTVYRGLEPEEAWELERQWEEEQIVVLSEAAKVLQHCRRAWWWERRRWKKAGIESHSGKPIWIPKRYVHTLIVPHLCGAFSETFVVPEHVILYDRLHWHHCDVYVLTKDGRLIERGWRGKYAVTQKDVNKLFG
jgi:hypothetical protein